MPSFPPALAHNAIEEILPDLFLSVVPWKPSLWTWIGNSAAT